MLSTAATGERAIAGRTSGLIGPGETVTWRARHLGVWQTLTSQVVAFDRPSFFADEMVQGAFHSFRHEHRFEVSGTGTDMHDTFAYTSPLGFLGRIADALFLKRYMRRLLEERNAVIRKYAEFGRTP
jgi:ligand-binding SRPBCC domain-containing protein